MVAVREAGGRGGTGRTSSGADRVTAPVAADREMVVTALTALVRTGKVMSAEPSGTVTSLGTAATSGRLLASARRVPPAGATKPSSTVALAAAPAITLEG